MPKSKNEQLPRIRVKLSANLDPTSATLTVDPSGELLTKVIRANKFQYYKLSIQNDQIGISKNGRYYHLVPSKASSDPNFNWFQSKFTWCVKNGGFNKNTATQVEFIINKYIKFIALKVFK